VHETNALLKNQRQEQKRSDLDEQLKEYIAEWRKQRAKEEEELKRLKV
jgi:troponin T